MATNQISVVVELVTPQIAETYLWANHGNRPIIRNIVIRYAREMTAGNWLLTHQGICFDTSGRLVDGQHRLAAILESGVSVQMVVTRGISYGNQIAMDDHAKRTAAASLSIATGSPITEWTVATVRSAIEFNASAQLKMSKIELRERVEQFSGPLKFLEQYSPRQHKKVGSACVSGAIALAWFYVPDLQKLDKFCQILFGIEMSVADDQTAALAMRDILLRQGSKMVDYFRGVAFRKTQRAIQAFHDGERLLKIYDVGVVYPWPLTNPVRTQ
jgi:hypothetical protein